MTKGLHVKIADCSYDTLARLAVQCGFEIVEGRKHCKVKNAEGRFITTIPRHNRLKRETARGIINALIAFGADISFS